MRIKINDTYELLVSAYTPRDSITLKCFSESLLNNNMRVNGIGTGARPINCAREHSAVPSIIYA